MLAEVTDRPRCSNCGDSRAVHSETLGRRIRCPACAKRKPDRSGKHLRALTKAVKQEISTPEALRMARVLANVVAQDIVQRFRFPNLPSHLVGVDRIMQRWAAAPTGSPSEDPDKYFKARPPPLDDKTQEKVGDIVKAAPGGIRAFVWDWYTLDVPTPVMAKQRRMSPRQLCREWWDVLVYLREKFRASGHPDLLSLVRQLP